MTKKRTRSISVLLTDAEFDRLERYCGLRGFKKSTLLARLVREHLDSERFHPQDRLHFGRDVEQR